MATKNYLNATKSPGWPHSHTDTQPYTEVPKKRVKLNINFAGIQMKTNMTGAHILAKMHLAESHVVAVVFFF